MGLLILRQYVVSAITQGRTFCVLTSTEKYGFSFFCLIGHWEEICAFMRTIAKGLSCAFSTRAPKVLFAFNYIYWVGSFLCYDWITHMLSLFF